MRNTPAQEPDLSTELAPDLGLSAPSNPTILNAHWNAHESATAENGQGAQVHSQHPIAIDIESRGWRGRALDPVLYIDERRFHQYSHPGPGLIRYVIADLSWVLDATRIGIQYGDDTQSWLTIPLPILEAP